ncbi:LacI family DNA-binding transcriptional regulator [Vibrio mediterranei]|uniref:LacI family transcriptional regulator n=1 Tax=Vibrio mediterranei TaxID=689 RepID=A0ABX5DAD2_9VIBR|nr:MULTISPECIES: LacI family DNA-binding transcriptional regulator [Vibrio]MCG9658502.1 LacI family DNA-binding transcriptional regulator [Vibrio mediterranei]MCG9662864.1 LacI family DNA-binding transcriptional regulator [Vibrio mediterranei]OIN26640.1 LacI family transcriptional regulator [Vibrio barjaei]PCD88494.1 LacI family transcriptional regulator [Vibrio mediterranei]PRQ66640.1 LacI family transcriptional regulator [Vibrio mediterranei]
MITIKEVAELAQVSQATVSRTLNGHASVKEANKEKVYAAMEQLGYQPNTFAQALASNRSCSIGMLVGTLDGPFYGPMMHEVEKVVRAENYHLIITSGHEEYDEEHESIRFLRSKKVDGLVLTVDTLSDSELLEISRDMEATVLINRYIPEMADRCIWLDNERGGFLATEFLINNGHTQIGCITGQLSKVDSRDRLQGYRNALSHYGVDYNPNAVVEGRFDHKANHDAIRRLLDRDVPLSAIFCMNDNIAMTAYTMCIERGIRVGEDISIIGFDNVSFGQHMTPSLTTINFPIQEMASAAARKVMAIVQGKSSASQPIEPIEPSVVVRASVKNLNK